MIYSRNWSWHNIPSCFVYTSRNTLEAITFLLQSLKKPISWQRRNNSENSFILYCEMNLVYFYHSVNCQWSITLSILLENGDLNATSQTLYPFAIRWEKGRVFGELCLPLLDVNPVPLFLHCPTFEWDKFLCIFFHKYGILKQISRWSINFYSCSNYKWSLSIHWGLQKELP